MGILSSQAVEYIPSQFQFDNFDFFGMIFGLNLLYFRLQYAAQPQQQQVQYAPQPGTPQQQVQYAPQPGTPQQYAPPPQQVQYQQQPQQVVHQQTVVQGSPNVAVAPPNVVVQPTVVTAATPLMCWGMMPTSMTCPNCHNHVSTTTRTEVGGYAILWAIILFFFACWPCCLIPFCMRDCQDTVHNCPSCGVELGRNRRSC